MNRRSSVARGQLLVEFSEADLNKLQLQYRKADEAKRAYTEKTQSLICRDRREIQRLQDEREELLRSLRVSQSCWTDASVVHDLTAKLACGDRIDEELEAEKGKVASLKDQILKWERKLAGQRSRGGITRHSMKSDNNILLKSTHLIENKLHRGRKLFNTMMTRNGELKEELTILQVEKKQFLHVRSLLEKELHAIRKDICKLMTKCTEAFNVSAKTNEKQRMLREQNDMDGAQYIKESGNLEREISRYCNFEDFIDKKANSQDIDHGKVEKHMQLESKELGPEDIEDAIKQILRETEESDLDELVSSFIQMEEQDYTLLNFVNYQHDEAETIRRQISQLCSEREVFVAEERWQQERHRALRVRVSAEQEAAEQQFKVYQQRVEFMEKLLDQLKEGVKSLLQISYGGTVTFDLSDGVQDETIKECLNMVEDRVNELLSLRFYLHFQNSSQWDIDSVSTIAVQLLGMTLEAVDVTPAAATPAPDGDPDMVESVLMEAKQPVSREDTGQQEDSEEKEDKLA